MMKLQLPILKNLSTISVLLASGFNLSQGAEAPAQANKEEAQSVSLPTVVVTATRTEVSKEKTASTVTQISRQEIEDNQYPSLTSALRTVPGLTIADAGTVGSVAGMFLRGTNSYHTAVLVDGRPLPANLAGTFNIETLSMDNIERIEVLSGPASALYGGNTIGGVINLVTRSGKGLEKPEGELLIEAGSDSTVREGISYRGNSGIVDYSIEGNHFHTDGERINSAYNLSNASAHLGAQVSRDLYLQTDIRFYDGSVGVPGPISGFGANDPLAHLKTRSWSISPGLVWQVNESWKQKLTYTYSNFEQEASKFTGLGQNNDVQLDEHFIDYQNEFHITDKWALTFGGTYQNRAFTRFNDDVHANDVDSTENNWSLFLQSQLEIAEGLNLVGGLRYDDYSLFGDSFTGRIGLSYRLPEVRTLVHANYGTAFAPPTPQDVQPALYGNPLLIEPERSRGWEAGIEQPFWNEKGTFSATYFRNEIRDLIQFDPTLFVLTQTARARTEGVEVGFKLEPCRQLALNANYTYLKAMDLENDVRLVRRPRHQLNAGLVYSPTETVRLGVSCNYVADREDGFGVSQQKIDDYVNVRLTASWKVTKSCELFGRLENLVGDHYQEILGYPANGRTFMAGLKVSF